MISRQSACEAIASKLRMEIRYDGMRASLKSTLSASPPQGMTLCGFGKYGAAPYRTNRLGGSYFVSMRPLVSG
jgi:hypothetical protein